MSATENEQTSIYEKTIEDVELENALDERGRLRDKRKVLNKQIRDVEGAAQVKIDALELGEDSAVRCGKWLLAMRRSDPKDVSFTRGGGTQLRITLLDE